MAEEPEVIGMSTRCQVSRSAGSPPADRVSGRSRAVLVTVAAAQLMVVLDGSIVNIALPAIQETLRMSDASRQWVVTAYGLAFGGLLLLGGRLSDIMGRRRAFLMGTLGFSAASALAGAAGDMTVLLLARCAQGAFAALLAPSVLAILTTTFPSGRSRTTAFGVFSAVAVAGGAVGLLLGGALTQWFSWRWTMFLNVPIACVILLAAVRVLPRRRAESPAGRVDVLGAVLVTLGASMLIYTFTCAESAGWASWRTLLVALTSLIALVSFVLRETRVENPLLPLSLVTDTRRAGALVSVMFAIMAMFGQFLVMTYYLQLVLGYSPMAAGLAFLPLTLSLAVGSTQIGTRLLIRFTARRVMVGGYLTAAAGFMSLVTLDGHSTYWHLLPGMIAAGIGAGTAGIAANSSSTSGVPQRDAGVASALLNSAQQLGGAVGTALLSSIATMSMTSAGQGVSDADTAGYPRAFAAAGVLMLMSAICSHLFVKDSSHGLVDSMMAADGSSTSDS